METKARDIIRHNHITRDIKERGKCQACDRYHFRQLEKRIEELENKLTGASIIIGQLYDKTEIYSNLFPDDKQLITYRINANHFLKALGEVVK